MSRSRGSSNAAELAEKIDRHPACKFQTDKLWLDRQYHDGETIKKPEELENEMKDPPEKIDRDVLNRIHGSMIGMALGDALGAFVEFRPHKYMVDNPVTTLKGGGTWGLKKGQFTDDTSMALCLANSLVARRDYVPYDQLVRYKWWYQEGYMSSTGSCFDIGAATRHSIQEFERRQKIFAEEYGIPFEQLDFLSDPELLGKFNVNCSQEGVAGNGALMRLAPVPLFFYRDPIYAVKCSGHSGEITHGDEKAYDACRYYGALIVAAVNGASKEDLLDDEFYVKHENWFDGKPLHQDIEAIARGSYKKGGYAKGIRGKGYIVNALEAALWAFWSENDSFDKGALAAVNLGDDTDTTAAIYGQLAGAYYGYENLRKDWVDEVYAKKFIKYLSKWIAYEGERWFQKRQASLSISTMTVESPYEQETNASAGPKRTENQRRGSKSSNQNQTVQMESISMSEQSGDPKSTFRPRRHTIHDKAFNLQPNSYRQHASDRPNSAENQKPPSERQQVYIHDDLKTVEDVCNQIVSLGADYKAYVKIFKKHSINGYWLLNQVDNENLTNYGVKNENHQKAILHEIERLKKECPEHYVS